MGKTEQICRALIVAARTTAAFVVAAELSFAILGMYEWEMMFTWNATAFLAFLGYAVFIMLPISRLPTSAFVSAVAVGVLLAVGSILVSRLLYDDIVESLLRGAIQFRILAWSLLIPIYAYIPIVILNRNHKATKNQIQDIGTNSPNPEL